jgi:hypothetical protein
VKRPIIFLTVFVSIASQQLTIADQPAHIYHNADGSKTYQYERPGGYDHPSETVYVRRSPSEVADDAKLELAFKLLEFSWPFIEDGIEWVVAEIQKAQVRGSDGPSEAPKGFTPVQSREIVSPTPSVNVPSGNVSGGETYTTARIKSIVNWTPVYFAPE